MTKRLGIAGIVLLAAFGLAACGGGGGGTATVSGSTLEERQSTQRGGISTAIATAETTVAGVDDESTDSEVRAAEMAVAAARQAITNAVDVPTAEKAANTGTVNAIANRLTAAKTSRTAALGTAAETRRMAMLATGRALRAALGGPEAGGNALANIGAPALATAGLTIDAAEGAGSLGATVNPDAEVLEAGDSAGALGSWNGMDYAHSEGTDDAKVTNEARVYTNQGAPTTKPFVLSGDNGGKYTLTEGTLSVADSDEARALVMATTFTHSGRQNHAIPEGRTWFAARGTYDGAPGEFRCTTAPCSSTNDGEGSPSGLGGTWVFKPDTGAMVSEPDGHYLYYGWWVSKDSDGVPTAASAFAGRFGTDAADDGLDEAGDLSTLTGSASYAGHAAGKFAMDNRLAGTGNGGHFTANATLEAKFSGTNTGVTGTIDTFRLNDGTEDPGWIVKLNNGGLGSTGGAITAPTGDDALATVWSINGNAAPASGTWSGTMYDEKPGDPSATGPGDGSNIPTTATGTFYSEFGSIGRMVGAFGVNSKE